MRRFGHTICLLAIGALSAAVAAFVLAPHAVRERMAALPGEAAPHVTRTFERLQHALDRSYSRAPVVVIGLLAAMSLPALGMVALATRRLARVRRQRAARRTDTVANGSLVTSPTGRAWLALDGPARRDLPLAAEIHRIGRDPENDLMLADPDISATHALIRRTPEAEFIVIDVSGAGSAGLTVNGHRLTHAALRDGDRIAFGATLATFHRALNVAPGRLSATSTLAH